MVKNSFGDYIFQLRKNEHLTQEKLGELLEINGKSVSKWERGITNPSINTLVNISKIFNVRLEVLLSLIYLNN